MAYKFQLGAAILSGTLVQEGAAEVDALTADSLNVQNGGITNAGAVAGATSIDGSGDLTMGTITMTGFSVDADGDTALKSLAVDNSSTIGCDADADIMTLAAQSLALASDVDFNIAKAGGLQLGGVAMTATAAELNLLDNVSGLVQADFTKLAAVDASAVELNYIDGFADAAYDESADSVVFFDATDSKLKHEAANDFSTRLASDGLKSVSGRMELDVNSLGASKTTVHQSDLFGLSDSEASDTTKKISFTNLEDQIFSNISGDATITAGGALTIANDAVEQAMIADDAVGADQLAANAVVNASIASNAAIDMDKLDGGSCAGSLLAAAIVQGDLLYLGDVSDSNNIKSATFSDVEDRIFANISGDATIAAGGALTIAAQAVENSMLADDAVGADELAANAVVNASVASNAAIALCKINTNVDMGGAFTIGSQSDDIATFSGGVTVAGDLIVQGSTTTVDSTTINISSSFTFEGPADDHETILTCGSPTADSTITMPQIAAGTYHMAVLADATTAAAAAVTAAEFAILDGGTSDGSVTIASSDQLIINDGGVMKQTAMGDFATYFASDGLKAAGNKLELDINSIGASALTAVAQNDLLAVSDADGSNVTKKITFSNFEDEIFGNVSQQASIAAGGALSLNVQAITSQTDFTGTLADTDELMFSDGGVLKKMDMSIVKTYMSDIAAVIQNVAAAGTLIVGVNYFSDMSDDGEDVVTLPASPSVGQSVKVKAPSDCSAARYITIAKAGSQTIDGAASIRLESPFAAVELVYVASNLWRVF